MVDPHLLNFCREVVVVQAQRQRVKCNTLVLAIDRLVGESSPVTDSCMLDVRGCGAGAVTMSVSQCRVTHFHTLLHPAFSCRGLVPTRWDITMLESGKGQLQSPPHDGGKWPPASFFFDNIEYSR